MDKIKEIFKSALLKAKSCGAQSTKIVFSKSDSKSVGFEAGRIKETSNSEKMGYSISVLVNDKLAEISGNRLDTIDKMIEQVVALARVGKPSYFSKWPGQPMIKKVKSFSPKTAKLSRQTLIDSCEQMIVKIKEYDPELFISSSGGKNCSEMFMLNSEGLDYSNKSSTWSISAMAQRTRGEDILFANSGRSWCEINEYYDPEIISAKVIEDLKNAECNVEPPKNEVKIFLSPNIFYNLISPIFMGINGLNVFKGDSPLRDKLGELIVNPAINIIDRPHIDFCRNSSEIDFDGLPTKEQTLIENGVLKTFLYDLDTAGMAKVKPTGNVSCSPYNAMITPGNRSNSEIISSLDDGIYMKSFLGFGQGNIINGDFSCNLALGYRIKNGQITGRLKDVMVSGNIYEVLKNNIILSSDTNYTGQVPYALVEGISVSSKNS